MFTLLTLKRILVFLKIRDVDEEHYYTEDGEVICCPVYGTSWLNVIEGDVNFDIIEHLRFSLHSDGGVELDFFGEWDSENFLDLAKNARERDDDADILDILEKVEHIDINKEILYIWRDDSLNHPWVQWGYNES